MKISALSDDILRKMSVFPGNARIGIPETMDLKNRTIELLAPAGSYDALCAVTEAGCDAVYIGGQRFGARAYADNPDTELLLRGIDYAHLRGVKVYLTVNTLLKEAELSELADYLRPMYEEGLDAVIVQDFGVMQRITEVFPDLPIHASTQMTILNGQATEILPSQVDRIVPARELSIDEIAQLRKDTDREIEIFVHGALCYCYSGQCLLSSIAGGRSGNRGRCAQPCRKMYRFEEEGRRGKARTAEGYILSPKDQCLLPWLHELLDTGIDSLKIEGRMKRPEYAAGVTGIYRRWLDRYLELGSAGYRQYLTEHDEAMAQDVRLLAELYNRGGFCGGYAFDTKGRGMICADRSNHTGVRVGRATVTGGDRPSAKLLLTEEIGPEEVLEFRSDEGIVYGEITTPKDMTRFDPDKPVMLRRDAVTGRLPHRLSVFRMKQEALLSDIRETFLKNREAIPVCGTFYAAPGEPMRLTVTDEQERACVTVTGAIPEAARQNPMRPEQFTEKLRKTGGSGYTWTSLSAEVKDGLFVPVSAINELRREALAAYEDAVLTRGFRHLEEPDGDGTENPDENRETIFPFDMRKITETDRLSRNPASNDGSGNTEPRCAVSVMTPEQTEAAMRSSCVTDLMIDMEGDYPACLQIVRAEKEYGAAGKMILLAMPRAVKGERREQMLRETDRILGEGLIGGIVVRTVDQLAEAVRRKAADPSLTICADSTLHVTNAYAAGWLAEQGCDAVTLSPELKRSEITQAMAAGAWITVYERLPLMISEQCPVRTMFGCPGDGSNPTGTLTDGEGNAMPVRSICRYCHSVIFNADVTSLLGIFGEVLQKQPFGVRVSFTTESRKDAGRILKTLSEALRGSETADPEFDCRCTRGHWKRGVL